MKIEKEKVEYIIHAPFGMVKVRFPDGQEVWGKQYGDDARDKDEVVVGGRKYKMVGRP